jgi:hypothetical protein
MRRDSLAGRDRKIIPVLLGFILFSVSAIAQDLPAGKPESLEYIGRRPGL